MGRVESIREELAILYNDEAKMDALAGWAMKRFAVENFLCFVEMVQFKERVVSLVNAQNSDFDDRAVVRHQLYEHCPRSSIVYLDSTSSQSVQPTDDAARNATVFVDSNSNIVLEEKEEEEETTQQRYSGVVSVIVLDRATNDLKLIGLDMDTESVYSLRQSARALYYKYIHGDAALQINVSFKLRKHLTELNREDYASLTPVTWISLFDETTEVLEEYIVQL